MGELKPVSYGIGKSILVEVSTETSRDVKELGHATPRPVDVVQQNLESVSTTIVETSQIMIGAFQTIASAPEDKNSKYPFVPATAKLEFGVRFSAEGNVYIAKASGEATLKVTVEWKFQG